MNLFGPNPTNNQIFSFLRQLENNQKKIASAHNRLEHKMSESEQKQILSFVKDFQTRNYDGNRSYTRIVIAAGYASFFALWSGLKADLPTMSLLSSSLLMTISVIVFITSEVYNMIGSQLHFLRLNELLIQEPNQKTIKEITELEFKFASNNQKVWLCCLIPTLLTAALGAAFLLSSFVFGIREELLFELHQ